jgi:nitric oxide reductase subunit C
MRRVEQSSPDISPPKPQTPTARRELMLLSLMAVYVGVSVIAHTDYPRPSAEPSLDSTERQGLEVWRDNNCQTCHQIHGFGGFLGPDLTNKVTEDTPDDVYWGILQNGLGRMPAFHLSDHEHDAVMAYLRRVNRTGRSQPEPLGARHAVDPWEHYQLIVSEWENVADTPLPPTATRGHLVWARNRCGACHIPFAEGRHNAPDLSLIALDRSPAAMSTVLKEGKGRMPVFILEDREIAEMGTFFDWVAEHRAVLVNLNNTMMERDSFSWTAVPWFEYAP